MQLRIVKVQHHDPWLPVLQRLSCQCMQFAAHSAQCLKYRCPKRWTFLIHHVQHCSQVWDGSHVLFTTLYTSVSVCQISISGSDVWAGNLLCCWHRSHACSYTSDIFMYTSLSWCLTRMNHWMILINTHKQNKLYIQIAIPIGISVYATSHMYITQN